MYTAELLNLNNRDHAGFMYDLAIACQDDFLNDYDNDIILIMNAYERDIDRGQCKAFLAKVNEQPAGIVWVEIGGYGVGRLRAGLMPEYRKGSTALHFLRQFVDYCFQTLELRKLDAEIALYGKNARHSRAAERLLRRFGFRKEGLLHEAITIDAVPKDILLFGLTRTHYLQKGKKDVHQQKQKLQSGAKPSPRYA